VRDSAKRWLTMRGIALMLVVAAVLLLPGPLAAQDLKDAEALKAQVEQLYGQGKYAEAIPLAQRVLAVQETVLGAEHPDVATALNNLAGLYRAEGRYPEAEPLYKRSLGIREKALGPDHPDVANSLNNLAALYFVQSNWAQAADHWRRATAVLTRRAERGDVGQALTGKRKSESQQRDWYFWSLVKAAYRRPSDDRTFEPKLASELFEVAQWSQSSEAAGALSQMAARRAKGDAKLAAIVRERQELLVEWGKRDANRSAFAALAPDKRYTPAEAENVARLDAIDTRVAVIDKRLLAEFPDYGVLVSPKPSSVANVQANLRPDEALILTIDTPESKPTPEETFIWVVTKTEMRWVRSAVGQDALKREVAALRCGLDFGGTWGAKDNTCAEFLKTTYTAADDRAGKPLPFDPARAYALYKGLFGEVEDLIKGKHLLIVPSGALTQLPFQVLVTAPPAPGDDMRSVHWLIHDHALTVLPSVASLKALRRDAKASRAKNPLIGFGNPLIDGPDGSYAERAREARDIAGCAKTETQRVASATAFVAGLAPFAMRGGLADGGQIRRAPPLPETADELCAVARSTRAATADIYLGARATEAEVKHLSETGALAAYRVVHFATHGALSGQVQGSAEPGLILTPPGTASETDDGYLSASEITTLKLDADWVILSACNTAAGGATGTGGGAEALSGLARAFFFAGARALLVSHWSVNSDATVKLITGALSRMAADKRIGRAEALRQSMLAMISAGAQPADWAPFVVVGEGAATR